MARGFLVSLTNPKTLFFYGAFCPQFVDSHAPVGPQLALLLSMTFLVVAAAIDGGWALFAGRLRCLLEGRGVLRNRVTGGVPNVAGVGLAAARTAT